MDDGGVCGVRPALSRLPIDVPEFRNFVWKQFSRPYTYQASLRCRGRLVRRPRRRTATFGPRCSTGPTPVDVLLDLARRHRHGRRRGRNHCGPASVDAPRGGTVRLLSASARVRTVLRVTGLEHATDRPVPPVRRRPPSARRERVCDTLGRVWPPIVPGHRRSCFRSSTVSCGKLPPDTSGASVATTRCNRPRSSTRPGFGSRTSAGAEWQGRTHGLALAAQAMRRLLVDHGRHQKRQKRGGGAQNLVLDELLLAASTGRGAG